MFRDTVELATNSLSSLSVTVGILFQRVGRVKARIALSWQQHLHLGRALWPNSANR